MAAAKYTLTDTQLLPLLQIIDCEELLQLSRGATARVARGEAWSTTTAHEVIALLEAELTPIQPEYRLDALEAAWDIIAFPEERAKATQSLMAYIMSAVSRLVSDTITGDAQCASSEEIHNHKRDGVVHSTYAIEDHDWDESLQVRGAAIPGSDAHLNTLDAPRAAVELPGRAYIDELVDLSGLPEADTGRILDTLADALDRSNLKDSIGRSDLQHAKTLATAVDDIQSDGDLAEMNGFPRGGGRHGQDAGKQWRAVVTLILGTSTSQLPGLIRLIGDGEAHEVARARRHISMASGKLAA